MTVAVSKDSDAHRTDDNALNIRLFLLFIFIMGLASTIEAHTQHSHLPDRNTLLPQFALVAKRQPLELSTPLEPFLCPSGGYARPPSLVFCYHIGAHKPPSRRTSVQEFGTKSALRLHVEMICG